MLEKVTYLTWGTVLIIEWVLQSLSFTVVKTLFWYMSYKPWD